MIDRIISAVILIALGISVAHAMMSDAQKLTAAYCNQVYTDYRFQISVQCERVVAGSEHDTVTLRKDEYAVIVRRAD